MLVRDEVQLGSMRRTGSNFSLRSATSQQADCSTTSSSPRYGSKSAAHVKYRNWCGRIKNICTTKRGARKIGIVFSQLLCLVIVLLPLRGLYRWYDSYNALMSFFNDPDTTEWVSFGAYSGIPRFHSTSFAHISFENDPNSRAFTQFTAGLHSIFQ